MRDHASERAKYEAVWAEPSYRERSPGARAVPRFLEAVTPKVGESLIDFGCGTGRAAAALARAGLVVTAIDITPQALDPGPHPFTFVEGCLWELPKVPVADWGYCADVMEHLPPNRVVEVLDAIAVKTRLGCMFNVANASSKVNGVELHTAIMPHAEWLDLICERYGPAVMEPGDRPDTALIFAVRAA